MRITTSKSSRSTETPGSPDPADKTTRSKKPKSRGKEKELADDSRKPAEKKERRKSRKTTVTQSGEKATGLVATDKKKSKTSPPPSGDSLGSSAAKKPTSRHRTTKVDKSSAPGDTGAPRRKYRKERSARPDAPPVLDSGSKSALQKPQSFSDWEASFAHDVDSLDLLDCAAVVKLMQSKAQELSGIALQDLDPAVAGLMSQSIDERITILFAKWTHDLDALATSPSGVVCVPNELETDLSKSFTQFANAWRQVCARHASSITNPSIKELKCTSTMETEMKGAVLGKLIDLRRTHPDKVRDQLVAPAKAQSMPTHRAEPAQLSNLGIELESWVKANQNASAQELCARLDLELTRTREAMPPKNKPKPPIYRAFTNSCTTQYEALASMGRSLEGMGVSAKTAVQGIVDAWMPLAEGTMLQDMLEHRTGQVGQWT